MIFHLYLFSFVLSTLLSSPFPYRIRIYINILGVNLEGTSTRQHMHLYYWLKSSAIHGTGMVGRGKRVFRSCTHSRLQTQTPRSTAGTNTHPCVRSSAQFQFQYHTHVSTYIVETIRIMSYCHCHARRCCCCHATMLLSWLLENCSCSFSSDQLQLQLSLTATATIM
jgi:hypothetical protein